MIINKHAISIERFGWWWQYRHDTVEALREWMAEPGIDHSTTNAALWQRRRPPRSGFVGCLHYSPTTLRCEMIHEALHIASAIWRFRTQSTITNIGNTMDFEGRYEDDPEERFANLIGWVADAVIECVESLPEFEGWPTVE